MSPIKLFETKQVRSVWDAERGPRFFSIVDVVSVLTDSTDADAYWRKLKQRLKVEGNETVKSRRGLKMQAADGKIRLTDVADTEKPLSLVQFIPSPKAEAFKLWFAQVGHERIENTEDPERALDRAIETYLKNGCSRKWGNQRQKSIEVRKEFADEWETRGIQKGGNFAILPDEIAQAWSGFNTHEYKQIEDLKKENLRDHVTNLELVLKMLAEVSTTEISRQKKPEGFEENRVAARQGGTMAGNTRKEIEEKASEPVVAKQNAKRLK